MRFIYFNVSSAYLLAVTQLDTLLNQQYFMLFILQVWLARMELSQ